MITRREFLKKGLGWITAGTLLEPLLDTRAQTAFGNDYVNIRVYRRKIELFLQPYVFATLELEKVSVYKYGGKDVFTFYIDYRTPYYKGEIQYGVGNGFFPYATITTPYYKSMITAGVGERMIDTLANLYYKLKPGERMHNKEVAVVREKNMITLVGSEKKEDGWGILVVWAKEVEGVLKYVKAFIERDNTIHKKPLNVYTSQGKLLIKFHPDIPDKIKIDLV